MVQMVCVIFSTLHKSTLIKSHTKIGLKANIKAVASEPNFLICNHSI